MMLRAHPTSRRQVERTIASARVVLASTCLLSIWLDPAEPARFAELTYSLHAAYVAYSLVVAGVVWGRASVARAVLPMHLGDIVVFSVFQYMTLGPSSPFFVYFIFSLFCGALRWGWQGTLSTSIAVVVAYVVMGVYMSRTLGPAEFELNRFIIRIAYLAVTAALLVYVGRHDARLRDDLDQLAQWPRTGGTDVHRIAGAALAHAAGVVDAASVVVVWETEDEPATHMASWSPGALSITRHAPGEVRPWVYDDLEEATFVWPGATPEPMMVATADGLAERDHARIHPMVHDRLIGGGLASAPFRTESVNGRVFFSGLDVPIAEIVPLVEVVARELGSTLGQLHMIRQLQDLASSEERLRVARDLHDGVLQSLTGIRLALRGVANELDDAQRGRDRLLAAERALAIEQRELRLFIDGLGPGAAAVRRPDITSEASLNVRLSAVRERIVAQWKVPITMRIGEWPPLPAAVVEAVPLMVHEAVVNAVKHAHPSRVTVTVEGEGGSICITVADDGHGFPFRGRYDHAALARTRVAPSSLMARVSSLGGLMSIESSETGSRVEMRLAV